MLKKIFHTLAITGFIFVACLLVPQNTFAANPFYNGTTMFVYGTAPRSDFTHQALINSYLPLSGYNAVNVVYHDVSAMSASQVSNLMVQDVANNPSAAYVMGSVGHGDSSSTTATYLTGPMNRQQWGDAINNAYGQNGVQGYMFEDSCGSGATCNLWQPNPNTNIQGVFTSTKPRVVGNDTNYGNGWQSDYGDAINNMLKNASSPGGADVNGDGVLTGKEVGDYLNKTNPGSFKLKPGDEDKPMFFKDAETAAKYLKYTECIILRPGQVDNSYSPQGKTIGDPKKDGYTVEYSPSSIDGYGARVQDEVEFPVEGQVQDTETPESDRNFDIRKLSGERIEKNVAAALDVTIRTKGISKRIVLLPDKDQAEEFVTSLKGVTKALGTYTVNKIELEAGRRYLVNNPDPEKKIVFDKTCTPTKWTPPSPAPTIDPSSPRANNGGNINTAPTADSGQGLMLAALMQALLGGQNKGQQGQSSNQNPYGAGYGNQQQLSCANQGVAPVCGIDGKTYTNQCWMQQQGIAQKSAGICSSSPNISSIINRVALSGIPSTLVDSLKNVIATMFFNILGGGRISETVIP